MRFAKTTTVLACFVALLAAGCGSSDDKGKQIPASTRQELEKQLTSVEKRFDVGDGACSDIAQNQDSVQRTIESLPADVDTDVRNALRDGFDRLFQLTAEQCDEQKNQKTETQPTESAPAPVQPEETTPTTSTPSETTPEEKPKKEKDGNGKGNGGGGGEGGGGGNGGGENVVPQAGGGGGGTVSP
jgi:cell division septation protein DedD